MLMELVSQKPFRTSRRYESIGGRGGGEGAAGRDGVKEGGRKGLRKRFSHIRNYSGRLV